MLRHIFLSKVYNNIYQLENHQIDLQNVCWDTNLPKLLRSIAFKLGLDPEGFTARLEMLLYMEKGSSIDWCSYVEEDSNVIGTLFIQLPSIFTGGEISVFDGDEEDEENEDFIHAVDLSTDEFCCHFLANYLDCQYEIAERLNVGSGLPRCQFSASTQALK